MQACSQHRIQVSATGFQLIIGGTLIDRLEVQHVLQRDHHMSLTEIMDMTPWQLDVKLLLIQRDLEEQAERLKKQKTRMEMGL